MWSGVEWTGLDSPQGCIFGRVQWSPYGLWGGLQSTACCKDKDVILFLTDVNYLIICAKDQS
jgi:hypothetical protein